MTIPSYVQSEDIYHVVPRNDLREHSCDRMECWCNPVLNDEEGYVVVHNSMDRREEYEEGKRLMS